MSNNFRRNLIFAGICFGVLAVYWGLGSHDDGNWFKGVAASQLRKSRQVTQMLSDLLASVEAKKNAILAGSDAKSGDFAAKSKAFSEKVEQGRLELLSVSKNDLTGAETKLIDEFTVAWGSFCPSTRNSSGRRSLIPISRPTAYPPARRYNPTWGGSGGPTYWGRIAGMA